MARMVRKQLYLDAENERKLKRLAQRWKCTEAAVVRKAIENLPDGPRSPEDEAWDRLVAMGIVKLPPGPPLTEEEEEEIEREIEELSRLSPNASFSRAVWEDREGLPMP